MPKRSAALGLALAVLLALPGCTAGGHGSETAVQVLHTYRGTALPQAGSSFSDAHPTVYWLDGRHEVALTTYGSSGCPLIPVSAEVISRTGVILRMRDDGNRLCTADLAATTSEFALPSELSRSATVRVTLEAKDAAADTLRLRAGTTVAPRAR